MLNPMFCLANLHNTLVFPPALCSKVSINVTINTRLNSHGPTPSGLCHLLLLPSTGGCDHLTTPTVAMFSQATTLVFALSMCPALYLSILPTTYILPSPWGSLCTFLDNLKSLFIVFTYLQSHLPHG